jgi:arylsulfatase A-like enzyme
MEIAPAEVEHRRAASPSTLSPRSAVLLAAWLGFVGGYVDLVAMISRRKIFGYYYLQGREFYWLVPLAGLVWVLVPGLLVALANRLRPGLVSLRAGAWLLATIALWGVLLRLPLSGVASLLLAAGLGRWASRAAVAASLWPRLAWVSVVGLVGVLVMTVSASTARSTLAGRRSVVRPQPTPSGAANVLLIVLDNVRAESMSLYGYARDTTPNLSRWARKGVRFDWAVAPATWSFPSHSSFFTGQWPYKLGTQTRHLLDAPYPTLAEFLRERGYLTAGIVANTTHCSYETLLDRGFDHYEDYIFSPRSVLASAAPGRWIAKHTVDPKDSYGLKWTRFQSRDGGGINTAFLEWLSRRHSGEQPFFAFLNYYDAHEPYVLPAGHATRFGLRPESHRDEEFLSEYWQLEKRTLEARDATLAQDGYDDCIAHLDRQIGFLLDELERRGVLRNTHVIITSDHGEAFGEHGVYDHGSSLYLGEIRVPLVILGPAAPARAAISEAVSLRELPATVVDLVGLATGAPFPGRSLAEFWRPGPRAGRASPSPSLSEAPLPIEPDPRHGRGTAQRGFTMSLVADGRHYIRDGGGIEELYELDGDPRESHNLRGTPDGERTLGNFRQSLREVLTDDPVEVGRSGDYLRRYRWSIEFQLGARH